MKPWIRRLVGVLSHVPLVYMGLFMGFFVWILVHGFGKGPGEPPIAFFVLMLVHLAVMLLLFGLLAFYVIWLIKGSGLASEAKIIWAIAVFFLGPVIMPILYWLYLRKTPEGPYIFGAPLT